MIADGLSAISNYKVNVTWPQYGRREIAGMSYTDEVKNGCPTEDLLASYLETRLTADEITSLEKHLLGCQRCRKVLSASVQTEDSIPPPVDHDD